MIGTLWYLIPLVIIIGVIKTPWFKGMLGEFVINVSVKLFLDKEQYHLIKNVTLPTEGGTTQIDHIIVSKFGIFVVETKNMKGWIYGSAEDDTWTQKIYRHKNRFQNPLRQNYKHVKILQSLLGLKDSQIHSIVVFTGDSIFKTRMPENVTHGVGYVRYIRSRKEPVLTEIEVMEIKLEIIDAQLEQCADTNRRHAQNVRNIIREKEDRDASSCPRHSSPEPTTGGDLL